MSLDINLTIQNIKNISNFEHNFSFENGIYAIVGNNAVGKSTLMAAIASTVYPQTLVRLGGTEVSTDSKITMQCKGRNIIWEYNDRTDKLKSNYTGPLFDGIYEGSIFSGTRFQDMTNIDKMLTDETFINEFVPANAELKEALSRILHGESGHYSELYKLKNMNVAREYDLINMPYFYKLPNGKYISKFKMSSGECMLISLLNFIISTASGRAFRRRKFLDERLLIFIDEVELALHPSSIDRLITYLEGMISNSFAMTVLFSTHSSELIRKMQPSNLFYMENNDSNVHIITPCYPLFAIRSLYDHDGYDCTILVEDQVSEIVIKKLITDYRVKNNLLINVIPVGSWGNTLELQKNISQQNAFGRNKFVFSIIDGDVKSDVNKNKNYENLRKLFLPIQSIEKYLYNKLLINKDLDFKKFLGNKYFTLESLDSILKSCCESVYLMGDKSGKELYRVLLKHLEKVGYTENSFIKDFSSDLFAREDFGRLQTNIEKFITDNFFIESK
ncbi:MAG: putative transporter ATPase component [Sporomusa sp.]|nr:putative transporter ATPase component [Sporomusa sp.]